MRYLARLSLLVLVGVVLCAGVSRVIASGGTSEEQNLAHWLLFELRRAEALDQRAGALSRATEAKRAIVAELLAGRLTGQEAVEQFRAVNENLVEEERSTLLAPYRIMRTQKEVERQLISWVRVELNDDPRQVKQVVHRLKEEFAQPSADTE